MASQPNNDDLGDETASLESMSIASERGSPPPAEPEVPVRGRGRPRGITGNPPCMLTRLGCSLTVDDPTLMPRRSRTRSGKL